MRALVDSYAAATGERVLLNLGASSTLARQIREGAPADLFLSADEATMDDLESRGLLLGGSRRGVLSNTLVVVVPDDSRLRLASPGDLVQPALRALALADPGSVPAGVYSRRWLREQGIWEALAARVVPTENVRGALAAVASGNVDAAIVYATDAGIAKRVRVAYEVPRGEGPAISYPFAVVARSERPEAARRLLDHLTSPAALAVFARHGFLVPGSD